MSSKIMNILIVINIVEITIVLGLYLLSYEVFWFYLGITLTFSITIFILIFKIILTSSQSDYNEEVLLEPVNSLNKEIIRNLSSSSTLESVAIQAKELNENVSAQSEKSETKVIQLTNQFGSLIKDIKSRIKEERAQIESKEISQKLKDEYVSDIKKTLKLELEKMNVNLEERIDQFSLIEEALNSRLEKFQEDLTDVLEHKIETAKENLVEDNKFDLPIQEELDTDIELTDEITKKLKEKEEIPEKDTEIIKEEDKKEPELRKAPFRSEVPENERYDEVTEDLIKFVEDKYLLSRDNAIELLQKIEDHQGKKLSNMQHRIYMKNKNLEDLMKILGEGEKDIPKKDIQKQSINLMGKKVDILKINEDFQEIDHKSNKFKIQKTMSGKSVDDFIEMEERIEKFFKNREILIAYCDNVEKFYLYYKK